MGQLTTTACMPGRSRALAVALKGQQTEEALVHLTLLGGRMVGRPADIWGQGRPLLPPKLKPPDEVHLAFLTGLSTPAIVPS